jgi:hypothetical protein
MMASFLSLALTVSLSFFGSGSWTELAIDEDESDEEAAEGDVAPTVAPAAAALVPPFDGIGSLTT